MRTLRKAELLGASLLAGLLFTTPSWAQEAQDEDQDAPVVVEDDEDEEEAAGEQERIVVTGSRIRRDEFTSIKPLQVISGQIARESGLIDTASILQESTVATGQQIDTTFNGFVLDNGPGSSTVDLRGLGADRTLTLINGRRVAPAGAEGAPGVANLNLIPSGMIERIDILLDGASSIYGSDAVAGVTNVILRSDFDGLEVEGFRSFPETASGNQTQVSARFGVNGDRGFSGFGLEWSRQDRVRLADRPFSERCDLSVEITEAGASIFDERVFADDNPGTSVTPCEFLGITNRVDIFDEDGSGNQVFLDLFVTPGASNFGLPGFSVEDIFGISIGTDGTPGAVSPVDLKDPFFNFNGTDRERNADLIAQNETFNFFSYGEYEVGTPLNITAFYEAGYANQQFTQQGDGAQIFPDVPGSNPFNPCNFEFNGGVNCATLFNDASQNVLDGFGLTLGVNFGTAAPDRNLQVRPIFRIRGDRDRVEVENQQIRMVGGLRGDLPFDGIDAPLGQTLLTNIDWEVYGTYSRSIGNSLREGVLEDRLFLSLTTTIEDPNNPGEFVCGLDVNGDGIPDPGGNLPGGGGFLDAPDCVPVNLFAPSIFQLGGGDFATQEERDFVFGRRTFNTVVEQVVISGFVSADLFELPGGTAAGLVGFEYREDSIDSQADDVAFDGLLAGFFADPGAIGSRDLREVFFEFELPLLSGMPGIQELTINQSARWTEEQNFGAAWTWSSALFYRPFDWATVRASTGTSFRAPNLREQFLLGQTSFNNALFDPCIVPPDNAGLGGGTGSVDDRDPNVIANCALQLAPLGFDPLTLGADRGSQNVSAEVSSGGATDLQEETSTSYNAGVVVEQPFFDQFELTMSATWWRLEVEDAIIEPGSQFIVTDCLFNSVELNSVFCGRIQRNATTGFIDFIDAGFINQDRETAEGVDFNLRFSDEFLVRGNELDVTIDLQATQFLERSTTFLSIDGQTGEVTEDTDFFVGEPFFPEWRAQAFLALDYGDFRLFWQTDFIDGQRQDEDFIDGFGETTNCFGADAGDVDCSDVEFTTDYFVHDVSLTYSRDTWAVILGVSNVFDTEPDFVQEGFTTGGSNVPLGGGYDLLGRRLFVNVSKSF